MTLAKKPNQVAASALDRLTQKQRVFVLEYLRNGFNATRAALTAGYKKDSARQTASENLSKPDIAVAIKEELGRRGITAERVKVAVAEIAFGGDLADFDDFLKGKASLGKLRESGVSTHLLKSASRRQTKDGESRRVELHDRLGALEKLLKIMGMMTDRIEHAGAVATGMPPGVKPEDVREFYEFKASREGGPEDESDG